MMPSPLELHDVIGDRYRVVGYVGAGGMQFVYAAEDLLIGRVVALKTPQNRSAIKRFKRSAILAARVNHPHVAKTLDYLVQDDMQFLSEELIEGDDLAKALLNRTPFLDPYLVARTPSPCKRDCGRPSRERSSPRSEANQRNGVWRILSDRSQDY